MDGKKEYRTIFEKDVKAQMFLFLIRQLSAGNHRTRTRRIKNEVLNSLIVLNIFSSKGTRALNTVISDVIMRIVV